MTKIIIAAFLYCILFPTAIQAQSMLKDVEDSVPPTQKVTGAFKSTRVINAHSIEMLHKGDLDFRIMHRFERVSLGVNQLYGLDIAYMRISFDYGISNNTTIGFGRSVLQKELDLFLKTRIIQQSTGENAMPFSLVIAAGGLVSTQPSVDSPKLGFADKSSYYLQLIAGRKFSTAFSFQISPIIVHTVTPIAGSDQTIFAMGGGARLKVSKRMAITMDYHHPFGRLNAVYTDPLSMGVDIETGGHVFQLQFSNAIGMNERAYITQTTGSFFKGDIRFGFNLSRIFKAGKHKSR